MWPTKTKVKSPISKINKFPLTKRQITTSDYYKVGVGLCREMIPNSKIEINLKTFARLNPMTVPVMGEAKIRHMLYFVPMRLLQKSFVSFITGEKYAYENIVTTPTSIRTMSMLDLIRIFTNNFEGMGQGGVDFGMAAEVNVNTSPYDFVLYYDKSAGAGYGYYAYQLTPYGKRIWNMLHQLGYRIDPLHFKFEIANASTQLPALDYQISAMPLLAMGKLYFDYLRNTQYSNITEYEELEKILNRNDSTKQNITQNDIYYIIQLYEYLNYDNDIFTSAFDNPTGPNASNISYNMIDDYVNYDDVQNHSYVIANKASGVGAGIHTPTIMGDNQVERGYPVNLSQRILDKLKKLTDYLNRHQIVGHNKLMKYISDFGVSLTSEQLNTAKFIGKCDIPIRFDDIFSTADTTGANLGQYAGRGIAVSGDNFKFETNEFGYLIDLFVIIPKVSYYQGIDRKIKHINRLDFFNQDFDALGNTLVEQSEVCVPLTLDELSSVAGYNYSTNGKGFGFLPAKYEYKTELDDLSGMFIFNSVNLGMDAFHLFRKLYAKDFMNGSNLNLVHSYNFARTYDRLQYDRAFYNASKDDPDNFIISNKFDMVLYAPMKPLYDTYEFDELGKEMTVDVAGTNKVTDF